MVNGPAREAGLGSDGWKGRVSSHVVNPEVYFAESSSDNSTEGLRERTEYVPQLWNMRKSLVKPVTRQNISSCSVLPPEIVMHDTFNVILWTSADICVVVHDDLGWKNRTTWYNCRFSAMSLALRVIFIRRKHPPIYALCLMISGGRTEQHVVIGFGELAAVD